MGDVDNQVLSVLLPASTISIFSHDEETLKAARALEEDWRFARVCIEVQEGDIDTASVAYRDTPSPDFLIVQTEDIEDSLTGKLENLAKSCEEGTSAIVIGPVNDVYLYRKLVDMGVTDYLVRPIAPDILANVLAKALIERKGVSSSRLVAFMGAKGGVGTSSLVRAASHAISDILDQKTILLDAGGGWSVMSVGMGFEPSTTLAEAAKSSMKDDMDSLERMFFTGFDKLHVLASGGDVMMEAPLNAEQIEELIETLMLTYPVVMVDLSHSSPEITKAVIARANQIVVVSTPTLPSLRLARSLLQEIKDVRGGEESNVDIVINMQGLSAGHEVSKADIEKAMGINVSSSIPFSPKAFMGTENESKKLSDDKEGAIIVRDMILPVISKGALESGGKAPDGAVSSQGFLGSFLSKMKSKE